MGIYNYAVINLLTDTVEEIEPGTSKEDVVDILQDTFTLVRDRSVYSCPEFAVRVCSSKNRSFSNTVLSLSSLLKYDDKPFIVILDTPDGCELFLANTTFLKKISHSSHELRTDNIKGSFNGSDILASYDGIENIPSNFEELFAIHQAFTPEENIERLVEATNNIVPHKTKFDVGEESERIILNAPARAIEFLESDFFQELREDLDARVDRVKDEIVRAAFNDNVNLRGRIIEELITSDDPRTIRALTKSLRDGTMLSINTDQGLGDYRRVFDGFVTETDIKTKVLFLQSAPKAYNIDKLLRFLSEEESVYLLFLIGIAEDDEIHTKLISVFDSELLDATKVQFHWAGRSSRGVTQFDGHELEKIIFSNQITMDAGKATEYLEYLISL